MVVVEHRDDDTKEPADLGQSLFRLIRARLSAPGILDLGPPQTAAVRLKTSRSGVESLVSPQY